MSLWRARGRTLVTQPTQPREEMTDEEEGEANLSIFDDSG
jgi:hypothetical protein